MMKNVIRHNDKIYLINRTLPSTTDEENATRIHKYLGTDTLLRDKEGTWFCCTMAREATFRDVEKMPTEPNTGYEHTGFELGDNGGMG